MRSRRTNRSNRSNYQPGLSSGAWRNPSIKSVRPNVGVRPSYTAARKSFKKKRLLRQLKPPALAALSLVILLVGFKLFGSNNTGQNQNPANQNSSALPATNDGKIKTPAAEQNPNLEFKFSAVGDMLPHTTVVKNAQTEGGYDFLKLISPELQTEFKSSDVRFCNHEFTNDDSLGIRGYPAFNPPDSFLPALNSFGCDLYSVGNNHINDYGQSGIDASLAKLSSAPEVKAFSGASRSTEEQNTQKVFEVNGIKVGFVSFSADSNNPPGSSYGLNLSSNEGLMRQQITGLRSKSDLVVVAMHWGLEDSSTPSASQKDYSTKLAAMGVDVVIGTGPHVWQPYQILPKTGGGQTHVFYSIGNGLNSQLKPAELTSGILSFMVTKNAQTGLTQVSQVEVTPTYIHYEWSGSGSLEDRRNLQWLKLKADSAAIQTTSGEVAAANLLADLKAAAGPNLKFN